MRNRDIIIIPLLLGAGIAADHVPVYWKTTETSVSAIDIFRPEENKLELNDGHTVYMTANPTLARAELGDSVETREQIGLGIGGCLRDLMGIYTPDEKTRTVYCLRSGPHVNYELFKK